MYLTGSRQHNLDSKVRLTLPAEYRREFSDKVILLPLPNLGALYGFTPEGFEAYVDGMFTDGYNARNPRDVKLRAGLNARATTVDIDSAGRIALGKVDGAAREKLGLVREVVIAGNGDHFEVWNPDRFTAEQESFEDDLEALMFG